MPKFGILITRQLYDVFGSHGLRTKARRNTTPVAATCAGKYSNNTIEDCMTVTVIIIKNGVDMSDANAHCDGINKAVRMYLKGLLY